MARQRATLNRRTLDPGKYAVAVRTLESDKGGYRVQVACDGWPSGVVGTLRLTFKDASGAVMFSRATVLAGGGVARNGLPSTTCTISGHWPRRAGIATDGKERLLNVPPTDIEAELEIVQRCQTSIDCEAITDTRDEPEIHHSAALVQDVDGSGANVASDSVDFVSLPAVGNHVIATVGGWNQTNNPWYTTNDFTDNQGHNYLENVERSQGGGSPQSGSGSAIYSVKVATSAGTFTVTLDPTPNNGNYVEFNAAEFSGLDATTHLDQTGGNTGTNTTTDANVTAAGANAQNDMLAVACTSVNANDTALNITTPTGGSGTWVDLHTNQDATATIGFKASYKIFNAAETSSATWTHDATNGTVQDGWAACIATYKAAAAGGRTTKNTRPIQLGIGLGIQRTVSPIA